MGIIKNKFIGSGLTFPIKIDSVQGKPIVSSDLELIHSSIGIILNWPKRTRWYNEEFGCRIEEVLEEPNDSVSRTLIKEFVREALNKWEKRIIVGEISTDNVYSQGRVDVSITYTIRNTKIEETVIFPYYTELKY